MSPGGGFPLPHNLLDEHDAEVGRFFSQSIPEMLSKVRIRVQGPTPQSSMQSMYKIETDVVKILIPPGKNQQYSIYPCSKEHLPLCVGQKCSQG